MTIEITIDNLILIFTLFFLYLSTKNNCHTGLAFRIFKHLPNKNSNFLVIIIIIINILTQLLILIFICFLLLFIFYSDIYFISHSKFFCLLLFSLLFLLNLFISIFIRIIIRILKFFFILYVLLLFFFFL